ncbi:MAG: hypothetical protein K8F24_13080, partial [Bacteroidales bacterium]|nr:hypothetical protein [Bacteroidales bacterium]
MKLNKFADLIFNIKHDMMAQISRIYGIFKKTIKLVAIFVFAFFLLMLTSSCQKTTRLQLQALDTNWRIVGDSIRLDSISIPAEVHLVLSHAGHIPDPFKAGAEEDLQWIARQQWIMESEFTVENELLNNDFVDLVFGWIDTYAHVFLNGEPLFTVDNMFREWRIPVKAKLLKTANSLKIVFPPTPRLIDSLARHASVQLPDDRAFMRKAAYQAGWDWAPEYRTLGLWKEVKLEAWSRLWLDRLSFLQREVDEENAAINLVLSIDSEQVRAYKLQLFASGRKLIDEVVNLHQGENELSLPFEIENPDLWWPNGMGEQPLTEFEVKLFDGNQVVFSRKKSIGLRN